MPQLRIALALLTLTLLALPASAQEEGHTLAPGVWTGQVIPPDGQARDVTFEVSVENDSLSIVLALPELGSFPFTDIVVGESNLLFSWTPGEPLVCDLALKEDGTYLGECVDSAGDPGTIRMVPPAQ